MQSQGVEVIHLGHNRSVAEIVNAAIQEDGDAIAVSSYQGGHLEFFRYLIDQLRLNNAESIKVFGGGGGVILKHEIEQLHAYGVTHIYSPEEGHAMGLSSMIEDLISYCLKDTFVPLSNLSKVSNTQFINRNDQSLLAKLLSQIENNTLHKGIKKQIQKKRLLIKINLWY
jgi:methylmalonyl-CoA mutase